MIERTRLSKLLHKLVSDSKQLEATLFTVLATLVLAAAVGSPRASAADGPPDTVQVTVPLLPETVPGAGGDPQQTAVVVTCRGASKTSETVLRPVADTQLWKDNEKPLGAAATIVLRDNRWSQGLFRIDTAPLAADAAIERAVFRFKAGGSERPGNARLQFHRMLADWSESATWSKPFPDRPETWNGLRPGKDYEAEPFAVLALDEWKAGGMVEVPGFEKAVEAWRKQTWPNYGFVVLFYGRALQLGIPSREAKPPAAPATITLGGPENRTAVLHVDLPLLARLLPRAEDLRAAALQLQLRLKGRPKPPAGAMVKLYRAQPGGGFQTSPFLSAPVTQADADGRLSFPGLENLIVGAAASPELSLLLAAEGAGTATLEVFGATAGAARQPTILANVKSYPHAPLLTFDLQPQPNVYCTMKNGHLDYGGRRLRLWGTVGYGAVERKRKMGFNCSRLWGGPELYDKESVKKGEPKAAPDAEPDKFDVELADTRKLGMFVMYAGLTATIPLDKYREPLLADDSFLAGGDDWPAWKEAVSGKIDQNRLTVFDERLTRLRFAHAKNLLTHRNPLTGKRLGEEEAIAVYEVWNELGFLRWALEGSLDKSPPYFRQKAQRRWNAWLERQYADDAALRKTWGRLEDGESLAGARIQLGPMLDQRERYPEARGRDFVRFWIELLDAFNQQFRQHCRSQMPAGVGVNVAPFSFDTQYRPSIPWDYTKALGDVNCFGMYFWGLGDDLAKPPSMYVIDNHTVADRPTVLYETNQARPCAYRSAYPQRIAALACWQDWDGVIFHYWGGIPEMGTPDERYLLPAMPHVNRAHYWSGVQHAFDPVMCASMAIAGRMFVGHAARPAPDPLMVDAGRQAIFGFDTYNGLALGPATFARGVRIRFAPESQSGVSVGGRPFVPPEPVAGAVQASPEIVWDWPNERLIVDTPTYKAYVGRAAGAYRFSDGLAISDINLPWMCFAVASDDGRPLVGPDASRRMLVSAVFDAKNRGFEIDPAFPGGGPFETADAIRNRGTAPVLVDKLGYTLAFPTEISGRFEGYDFALRRVVEEPVAGGNRFTCAPRELHLGVLTLERRGKPAATPETTLPVASSGPAAVSAPAGGLPAGAVAGLWNPVPGLAWGVDTDAALKTLRETTFAGSRISQPEAGKPDATIAVTDARLLWRSPADLVLSFRASRLRAIRATLKQPPALVEAVADYEKRFGPPVEKRIARQEEVSRIRWQVKQDAGTLEIVITEAQGTMSVTYEATPR